MTKRLRWVVVVFAVFGLIAASCGDDADDAPDADAAAAQAEAEAAAAAAEAEAAAAEAEAAAAQAEADTVGPEIVVANQVYRWDVVLDDLVRDIQAGTYGGNSYEINFGRGRQGRGGPTADS
jgi:membrane protein involved in colicin uptake